MSLSEKYGLCMLIAWLIALCRAQVIMPHGTCLFAAEARKGCGAGPMGPCTDRGCCWDTSISGVAWCYHHARQGHSLWRVHDDVTQAGASLSPPTHAHSVLQCGLYCQNDVRCLAFNYQPDTGTCALLTSLTSQAAEAGWTSGVFLQ